MILAATEMEKLFSAGYIIIWYSRKIAGTSVAKQKQGSVDEGKIGAPEAKK